MSESTGDGSSAEPIALPGRFLPRGFVTASGVYGTILIAGIVFAASTHDESAWDVFWIIVGTVVVLWAAHVYADTVAEHGRHDDTVSTLGDAFRHALRHSRGLPLASVVPVIFLLLGSFTVLSEDLAVDLALWSAVVLLAILGYLAYRDRGARMLFRIIGSLGTAAFGGVIIVLNALIH